MPRTEVTSIAKETIPMLMFMALGGTFAGLLLSGARTRIEIFPGLLILLPAMQDLRGNIGGSLASRLSTALHQGTLEPRIFHNDELGPYALASLSLSAVMSLVIGVVAFVLCVLLEVPAPGILEMLGLCLAVGTISGMAHVGLSIALCVFSFRRGLDPDNTAIPSLTLTGDIFTVLCFVVLIGLVT